MKRTTLALVTLIASHIALNGYAVPIADLPGLESISIFERTGGSAPTEYLFSITGPELTTRLDDPLSETNNDISGAPTEYYDVYYSNADGIFNSAGEYLTISGVFEQAFPAGGGLNLAEMVLNFASGVEQEFGTVVASFVALGDNAIPGNVDRAIDGDLLTHTTMGNSLGSSERLRLTLGFESSVGTEPPPAGVPEPGPLALVLLGLLTCRLGRQRLL